MASQSREKQADPNAGVKAQARRRLIGAGVVSIAAAGLLFSVLEREPKPASPDIVLKGSQQSAPLSPPISVPSAPASAPVAQPPAPVIEPSPKAEEPKKAVEPTPDLAANNRPPLVVAPLPKADVAPQDPIAKLAEQKSKPEVVKEASKKDESKKDDVKKVEAKKEEQIKAAVKKDEAKKDEAKKADSTDSALKGYSVQIGAFSNKESAQNALAKIKDLKLIGYTENVSTPQGNRIRVRAGPYKDKGGAQSALNKLKAAGIEAAMVAP